MNLKYLMIFFFVGSSFSSAKSIMDLEIDSDGFALVDGYGGGVGVSTINGRLCVGAYAGTNKTSHVDQYNRGYTLKLDLKPINMPGFYYGFGFERLYVNFMHFDDHTRVHAWYNLLTSRYGYRTFFKHFYLATEVELKVPISSDKLKLGQESYSVSSRFVPGLSLGYMF